MDYVMQGNCPHCGTRHVALNQAGVVHHSSGGHSDFLAQCGHCERGVLVMVPWHEPRLDFADWNDVAVAPPFPDSGAPKHTPPNVARFFQQGMRNLPGNWDAAGAMFRKTLDTALKANFPSIKGDLKARIRKAAERGALTTDMAQWADRIRDLGNDAAHEEDPFTKSEAEELCGFTRLLLLYLFTLPGMLSKARGEPEEGEAAGT